MRLLFNLSLAWRAMRGNGLRTVLTVLIIGIGITALVGILTAIDVLKSTVTASFSSLGSNSFQITSEALKKKKRRHGVEISLTQGKDIRYSEAVQFKARYSIPARVGISTVADGTAIARRGSKKTNPNVRVMGVDEEYLPITDTKLRAGRNFSRQELEGAGSYVCILGHGLARKLWRAGKETDALNGLVTVSGKRYRVIGVALSQGGSMIMDADNTVLIPVSNARAAFGASSFVISVQVKNVAAREAAAEEAEGLMRVIRKVPLGAEADFGVQQNDALAGMVIDSLRYVRWAAVLIGIITLLGSVVGLTNILLVSVAERTREIGVSKALGAKPGVIRGQFLTEALLISGLGGLLGIVLGLGVGNLVALALEAGFVVPWAWMGLGVALCGLTGVLSGLYPALKAARLDPIVALRHE